ncbi:MAG: hypothetical protein WA650_16205 [Bradyrhizobium sp.]|jgi:hypothetical protein
MKNRPLPSPPPVPPATRAEVDKFLKGLQEFRAKDGKSIDEAGIKQFLDKMTVGSQQAIGRRIMMDILKSPPSERRDEPERKRQRPKRKPTKKTKTSPKSESKRASKKKRSPVKKKKAIRRR